MKIYIQPNWSEQFILWDESPGIFVWREQEIKNLKHIVLNNDSSSILVSSVRGVGKTSFIHKALSEVDSAISIFVNIWHALSENTSSEGQKRLVLVSLIRAIHFNWIFEKDKDLEDLYKKCFWNFTIESTETNQASETKTLSTLGLGEEQVGRLWIIISTLLLALGFSLDEMITRIILWVVGTVTMFFSFNWKKEWTTALLSSKSITIDNSTEYLEIEFEKWLKSIRKEWKKLVFVIDELDKVDEKKSLGVIKEYKNLFTRSFAHFIFIASQRAYDLVNCNREDGIEEGWSFPTFFTHIFYLSLPTTTELKEYLNNIFPEDLNEQTKDRLSNYLLFLSGNDFFELKRLIGDLVMFDEDGKVFIDTESIEKEDVDFEKISQLFSYVDKWVLSRRMKHLKKSWKENSQMQSEIFKFLNKNFNKNFTLADNGEWSRVIGDLIVVLVEIWVISSVATNPEDPVANYYWTWKYNRPIDAPLLEQDREFMTAFGRLISLANDLDDLPEVYEKGEFQDDYNEITEGRDGQNVSGINLFSLYSDYKDLFGALSDSSKRIAIPVEKTQAATDIINERIKNIFDEYFKIFINVLDIILKKKGWVFLSENIKSVNYNIPGMFSQFPDFIGTVWAYDNRVYGLADQSKYVLIIRNFEDIDHIVKSLQLLRARTDILIVDITFNKEYSSSNPEVLLNKIWRRGRSPFKVKNFVSVHFNDYRELAPLLRQILSFLSK